MIKVLLHAASAFLDLQPSPGIWHIHKFFVLAGSWDLQREGKVYAIAIGPYGLLLALCWNRDASGQPSSLVLLGKVPGAQLKWTQQGIVTLFSWLGPGCCWSAASIIGACRSSAAII